MSPFAKKLKGALEWAEHGDFAIKIVLGLGIGKVSQAAMKSFTNIPSDWITPIWLFVAAGAIALLLRLGNWVGRRFGQQGGTTQVARTASTLATAPAQFDVDQFFSANYTSPIAIETSDNMRAIARAKYTTADERESFYVRLIGVGIVAYFYDMAWMTIYKSQVLLLQELNSRMLTRDQTRTFYDSAAAASPAYYATYSFDQWLEYLLSQELVIHQGVMVAITMRGRDFLKFLVHWGRSANQRLL